MNREGKQPLRVFLSHAVADREVVRRMRDELAHHGFRVFAVDMLSAGGGWQARLREEIAQSDVYVVLLTPEALGSPFVLQELGAAWALGKRVVVVAPDPRVALPLDLSADAVITDLADLDPLLQAIGRSQRAGESEVEPA